MRFYRALLHLYPVSFRREYGVELCAVVSMRLRQTGRGLPTAAFWLATIIDVTANATAAHWDVLRHDLRYTFRTLLRSPGFVLTAVLVTALGIGANTAAFSVADFVLLRRLPFADPDRLVKLWESPPGGGRFELSPPNYRDYKEQNRAFAALGAFHNTSVNLVGLGEPQRLTGSALTGEVLPILGVTPLLGRAFTEADERAGEDGNVILSYGLWQRNFGGGAAVLGQRVLLDGNPRVVNVVAASLAQRFPKENKGIGASVIALRDELSNQSDLMLLALCGVLPGVALAYVAGRAMQSLLFGVEPGDGATFAAAAAAAVLCVLMTMAGSLVPVFRAVSVAPADVFRGE